MSFVTLVLLTTSFARRLLAAMLAVSVMRMTAFRTAMTTDYCHSN